MCNNCYNWKCVILYFQTWKIETAISVGRVELHSERQVYEVWIESYELGVKICASQIWKILFTEDRMKRTFMYFTGRIKQESKELKFYQGA